MGAGHHLLHGADGASAGRAGIARQRALPHDRGRPSVRDGGGLGLRLLGRGLGSPPAPAQGATLSENRIARDPGTSLHAPLRNMSSRIFLWTRKS